jgi:hypothetical protein
MRGERKRERRRRNRKILFGEKRHKNEILLSKKYS